MKTTKSAKSLTSVKSTKSMRTTAESASKKGDIGEFIDLATVVPTICAKLQCPHNIVVKKKQQTDDFYKSIKYGDATPRQKKKLSILPAQATLPIVSQPSVVKTLDEKSRISETETEIDDNTIIISGIYDTYNCLTEILLHEIKVPRVLIQVIAILVPYFQNLTTLTVRRCCIDFYVIHEITKILELSNVTTICLDNSPVIQHTYEVLLNEKSSLRNLSLCKCKLDDDDCQRIALKLHFGAPAEDLQTLNLSSNHITDVGVQYICEALRTNRRLRYLSLADNWISDEGAGYLFGVFEEFPLTYDEITNMRTRYMKFLKCKQALYTKYLSECEKSFDDLSQASRKSSKRKKSGKKDKDHKLYSDEDARDRAELLANEILGQFTDPFDSNSIKHCNNYYYCLGNMVLSYLNLAYNNLSFVSLKKLLNVVMYQNVTKNNNQSGLIKVLIEGNNLPIICKELILLNELFSRNVRSIVGKTEIKRRRSIITR